MAKRHSSKSKKSVAIGTMLNFYDVKLKRKTRKPIKSFKSYSNKKGRKITMAVNGKLHQIVGNTAGHHHKKSRH
jgi:hypothetical protein